MLKLLFLERFSKRNLTQLHHAVFDHYAMFTKVYPNQEITKHHWLLHVMRDILLNGPAIQSSCMKLEMTHQYFKQLMNSRTVKREFRHTHRTLMSMAQRYCRLKALVYTTSGVGSQEELGHSLGKTRTVELPEDSSLSEMIMDSDFAQLAFMRGAAAPISCTYHSAYKYGRCTVKDGRLFACLVDAEIVYGQVTSIITALGVDFITYSKFTSSKIVPGGDVRLLATSLETTQDLVEFGEQGLTFARNSIFDNSVGEYTVVF